MSACKCEVPFINRVGRMPLKLSVQGSGFKNYFYGNLNTKSEPISLDLTGLKPFYRSDQMDEVLNITWNSKYQQNISNAKSHLSYRYVLFMANVNTITGKTNIKQIIKDNLNEATFHIIRLQDLVADYKTEFMNFIGIGVLSLSDTWTNGYLESLEYISRIDFLNVSSLNADSKCREWHRQQPNPQVYLDHFCRNNIACRPNIDANVPASFDTFIQDKSCNPKNPKYCDVFHPGIDRHGFFGMKYFFLISL